VKVGQQEKKKQ